MIQHKPKINSSVSIPVILICIVTFFFPFVNILYLFLPINFLGKNLWIVIPIFVITVLFVMSLVNARQFMVFDKFDIGLLVIAMLGVLIHSVRELLYSESRSILDLRYIISSILFLLVFKRFVQGEKNQEWVTAAVLLTCFMQAVLGILHAHFFSHININVETLEFFLEAERTREGGTLGSSIYANFIVCGMFLLVARSSRLSHAGYGVLENIAILVMLYAVTLSGSRYPMFCAFLLTAFFLFRSLSNWRQTAVLLGAAFIVTSFVLLNEEGVELYSILRFSEDTGGRFDKLVLPLMLLFDRLLYFLIGVPSDLTAATFSEDGFGISDNSYMLMALQSGVLFAVVWFSFFINLLRRNVANGFSFFFMIYVLIGLGLTNSILWEPWSFVAMLISILIYNGAPAYRWVFASQSQVKKVEFEYTGFSGDNTSRDLG